MYPSLVENTFSFIVDITVDRRLLQTSFSFLRKIPVDRGLSGIHQKNRSASDFYDSSNMQLGSRGIEWDAYVCMSCKNRGSGNSPIVTILTTYENQVFWK